MTKAVQVECHEHAATHLASALPKKMRTIRMNTTCTQKWMIGFAASALLLLAGLLIATRKLPQLVHDRIIAALEEHFESRVQVKSLDVVLFPAAHITASGLVLKHRSRTDVPPLIMIDQLTADTSLRELLRNPTHISQVRLHGLRIQVMASKLGSGEERPSRSGEKSPRFLIGEVIADGAVLETIPKSADKVPLVWELQRLILHDAGPAKPMIFESDLTNAKPPGRIQTKGSFGPWNPDEPSLTPVSGHYTFRDADLGVFKGISGRLSSQGAYNGVLQRIEVQGQTDTPDFAVSVSGNRIHLQTRYQAVVDGTDGTTYLQPVDATFGHTSLLAHGVVLSKHGVDGKTISLNVQVREGHMEDLLRLAVKGKPSMTGGISFHTSFLLPPGDRDISERLKLKGTFDIGDARFLNGESQAKIEKLSNRGRGITHDVADDSVASNFRGAFALRDGVIQFTNLAFEVPGVQVLVNGTYSLQTQEIDLHGTARMQAKVSHMTTGFKSFLLKAVDPFFAKKGAGAVLPIKIQGTGESPTFGLEFRRKKSSIGP
jgi:hypothetical protein